MYGSGFWDPSVGISDTGWGAAVWCGVDREEVMARQREHLPKPEPKGAGTGRDTGSRLGHRHRKPGGKFKAARVMVPSRPFSS